MSDNYIHPTAVIGPNVKMGTGNYIGPFCIIGYPAEHKAYWTKEDIEYEYFLAGKYHTIPAHLIRTGSVEIGDNCVFTGHVTVDAGTEGITTIADRCWFLKHSHVGHDALICQGSTISCGAKIGGHATIGLDCNIGLNACIHQRVKVPQGCMIGMNAAVTKKLEMNPFRKYAGVPAKDIGPNIIHGTTKNNSDTPLLGPSTEDPKGNFQHPSPEH